MIKMPPYDEQTRSELRSMFAASGVEASRAAQIVDLACLAAETAMNEVIAIAGRGPDYGVQMMALEIALQLGASRMTEIFKDVRAFAGAEKLPQFEKAVKVSYG